MRPARPARVRAASWLAIAVMAGAAADDDPPPTRPLRAPKFGLAVTLPETWPVVVREREDTVFAALIPRDDPERPGVVACELGLAPESLDEYRTRIDGNARRGRRPGKLVRNEVVRTPRGERLETVWEFRRGPAELWIERSVRLVANRQMYTFVVNADEKTYALVEPRFDALVDAAEFSPPDTGADPVDPARNRWAQREFKFALDLPDGWRPALAPSEVALLYANGPAHGIWSDNALVIARPHGRLELEELARTLPDGLRAAEPGCEVLRCEVVDQGRGDRKTRALETVVRTQRGPFSMTVVERRFRGQRFDYEVKFTLESERLDPLLPAIHRSLDSFEELPGDVPAPGKPAWTPRFGTGIARRVSSGPPRARESGCPTSTAASRTHSSSANPAGGPGPRPVDPSPPPIRRPTMRLPALLLPLAVLFASAPATADDKAGLDKLKGTWKAVKLVNDGEEGDSEQIRNQRLVIEASGKFTLKMSDNEIEGTLKVDPDESPAHLDATHKSDDGEGGVVHCIYKLEGDRLTICWSDSGDRPTEFAAEAGSGNRLMVLERDRSS